MVTKDNAHYWNQDMGKRRADAVFDSVKRIEDSSGRGRNRMDEMRRRMSEHYNRRYSSLDPGVMSFRSALPNNRDVIVNTALNVGETLAARVCIDQPKPDFLTVGGSWRERYKAKGLNKFISGEFHRLKTYELAERCFRDITSYSDVGAFKVTPGANNVEHERVFPGEIIVDEQACITTDPRTLYQRKWVPAEVLRKEYGSSAIPSDLEQVIKSASKDSMSRTDLIEVIETWHLPSIEGADDGRHVIAIKGVELEQDEYTWDMMRFPFSFIWWTRLPVGFYGQSLQEQQGPLQREHNRLMRKFSEAIGLTAFMAFVEEGSLITDHLKNQEGGIIKMKRGSKAPTFATPGSIAADAYGHAWKLMEQQYESSGVSQASAAGKRPTQEISGTALRHLDEIETLRHGLNVRSYQRFLLDIADLTVQMARKVHRYNPDYKANYIGKRFVETIDWKDVALDHYVLQLWSTNILPSTPTGKLATTQDMLAANLITEDVARALLDFPDIERYLDNENVEIDYIDYSIERIMIHDEYDQHRPTSYQSNLALAVRRAGQAAMKFRMEGATAEDVDPLERWIVECGDELVRRQARIAAITQSEQPQPQLQAQPQGGPQQ